LNSHDHGRLPPNYIRKQPKGYGGTKQIEGILEANQRVLLVEDLITDGMSKLRFNIGIRGAGSKITHCLCVFEYGSDSLGLHEGQKKEGGSSLPLAQLTTFVSLKNKYKTLAEQSSPGDGDGIKDVTGSNNPAEVSFA
jgi:orotate phosphoribosyltransferase